ncbi:MAG: hypothetical protein ACREF3_08825 [Acetobacteraceae bacterium]
MEAFIRKAPDASRKGVHLWQEVTDHRYGRPDLLARVDAMEARSSQSRPVLTNPAIFRLTEAVSP